MEDQYRHHVKTAQQTPLLPCQHFQGESTSPPFPLNHHKKHPYIRHSIAAVWIVTPVLNFSTL